MSDDEDEHCIICLKKLKIILGEMPRRLLIVTDKQIKAMTEKIYAEEDGSLTFVLCGELELNVKMDTVWH